MPWRREVDLMHNFPLALAALALAVSNSITLCGGKLSNISTLNLLGAEPTLFLATQVKLSEKNIANVSFVFF